MRIRILLTLLLIIILSSCSNVQPPSKQIIFPTDFSLLDSANPESEDSYLARMEKYDNILKASPIPIYLLSSEEFASEIFLKIGNRYPLEKISRVNIMGMYFHGQKFEKWPNEFIFINKNLTPEQVIVTYFHEVGHYYHRINKCQECIDNPIKREEHALYNELKMGWEHDAPKVLESSIRTMALYMTDKNSNISYRMATSEIMGTDLFRQTMKYLKEVEEKK